MVNYRLRDDLLNLYVCLYNPSDSPERQYSLESLQNYIRDCEWQLGLGIYVKRMPFYISVSKVDAERAIEEMNRTIRELKREQRKLENQSNEQTDSHGSWGYTGGFANQWK